jgi:hypothetical protein
VDRSNHATARRQGLPRLRGRGAASTDHVATSHRQLLVLPAPPPASPVSPASGGLTLALLGLSWCSPRSNRATARLQGLPRLRGIPEALCAEGRGAASTDHVATSHRQLLVLPTPPPASPVSPASGGLTLALLGLSWCSPGSNRATARRRGFPRLRGRGAGSSNRATARLQGLPRLRGIPEALCAEGRGAAHTDHVATSHRQLLVLPAPPPALPVSPASGGLTLALLGLVRRSQVEET